MEKSVHGKSRGDSWKMKKSNKKSAIPNMTLTPDTMEANKRFLVDGIVRTRPTTPNVILALLKTPNMILTQHCALWGTTWRVKPAWFHTIVLSVTLDSYSASAWRNTWSFILWRIHICVLCVVNDSSPGTITSDTCRVMLGTIHIYVLYVTKNSSPETTHRDTIKFMLWIAHIHVLSISINHQKRHIDMNNGKFDITVLFNIQELLQEIFSISFGNVIVRHKNIMGIPC